LIYTANIAQITVQWMLWRTNWIHTVFIADMASQYLSNVKSGLVVERKGMTRWETCQVSVTQKDFVLIFLVTPVLYHKKTLQDI